MAGPFARLRRGGDDAAEPEAATAVVPAVDPATTAVPDDAAPTDEATPTDDATPTEADPTPPSPVVARGQIRRRARYLRRAREVALRDLGGLVFELHRFGRDRGDLVDQKLTALTALDAELRTLETELDEPRDLTVLREPGLASCPQCGALHSSDAHFCSNCGRPVGEDPDPAPAEDAAPPASP